jgi:hypothetical protein
MTNVHVRVKGSTVCKIDEEGHRHFTWKVDNELTGLRKERKVITDQEVQKAIDKADELAETKWGINYPDQKEYFQLRAKAIVSVAKIFGKRRSEIADIFMKEIHVENNKLSINFVLRKKRKRGLFQYQEILLNKIKKGEMPREEFENKTQGQIISEWKDWRLTEEGTRVKKIEALKETSLDTPFVEHIVKYWKYMKTVNPKSQYLFPNGKAIFSQYQIDYAAPIEPQSLLLIVQDLDPDLWMHLYRKTKGTEIAKAYGRTIDAVGKVKKVLNLEREETAWRYIEDVMPASVDVDT